ncbi:MAG: hypothetical protein E3K37_07800 [Candidatus Kuenenia sp.]|nr:hypothetical protein [Candidatus Kuenenia hertensis]
MRKIFFCKGICIVFVFSCLLTTRVLADTLDGNWKFNEKLCYDSSIDSITPTPTPTTPTIPIKKVFPAFVSTIPRERIYNSSSDDTSCSKNKYTITIEDEKIYSDGVEVGSVSREGKNVTIQYDEAYLISSLNLVFELLGMDITIEEAEYLYKGKLKNKKKKIKGDIEGHLTVTFQGIEATMELSGTFNAKKKTKSSD